MPSDRDIIRELARRLVAIAHDPVNLERRRLWLRHNSLDGERPMILAEASGVLNEVTAGWPAWCQDDWHRGLERAMRLRIYQFEQVGDDAVVEPFWNINWRVALGDYGVRADIHRPDTGGTLGSYVWDAPIKDIARDFHLLRPRTCSVDRAATLSEKARFEELFGDILPVRIRGAFWWTFGLTWEAIKLIGLQQLMLFMYDDPSGLHRLMEFLRDDHAAVAAWVEREGLLSLNNKSDYIGSGGHGYCADLPRKDYRPGGPARLKDLWVLLESQETVGVGPELFEEFIFPYQRELAKLFGLVYYGCCEPVHSRWHIIRQLPNLRSVSISPWCDQRKMAEQMGRRYVFCRKPAPSMISTERFDEEAIRADIRQTLDLARGCEIEFAMKDVHTMSNQPQRLGRWVQLCREECARVA